MITVLEFAKENYHDLDMHDEGGFLGIDKNVFALKLREYAKLAIEEDRKNLLKYAEAQIKTEGSWISYQPTAEIKAEINEDSILNAPQIELL